MITHRIGNLLETVTEGHILHGCNAQGVMGSGFAKQVKLKYPHVFETYKIAHSKKFSNTGLVLGNVVGAQATVTPTNNLYVWNMITQEFYGYNGKRQVDYNAVRSCMKKFNKVMLDGFYDSYSKEVHFPLIGCGLGGGSWKVISAIIDEEITCTEDKYLWTLTSDIRS